MGLREGTTTEDYRDAMGGSGELAYEWSDKPHRLVYDLCNALDEAKLLLRNRITDIADLADHNYPTADEPDGAHGWLSGLTKAEAYHEGVCDALMQARGMN